MNKTGILYLIPSPLSNDNKSWLNKDDIEIVNNLLYFIAENPKTTRKHLSLLSGKHKIQEITISTLNNNTNNNILIELIKPLIKGNNMGLMSEAGCPTIADPGSNLVNLAHKHNIEIIPLVGPCSIILSLMASGFNGQNFCFHGYLPINENLQKKTLKKMQLNLKKYHQTQIFIETPYRNQKLLNNLINNIDDNISISIAINLTSSQQKIYKYKIKELKEKPISIDKIPSIFLLGI